MEQFESEKGKRGLYPNSRMDKLIHSYIGGKGMRNVWERGILQNEPRVEEEIGVV